MSFHPTMPYGTEQWHRSQRATLPEGPEFSYTPEHRQQFEARLGAQVKVDDHGAQGVIIRECHGIGNRSGLDRPEPVQAERARQHPADAWIVVHDQDIAVVRGRLDDRGVRRRAPECFTPLHAL